MLETLPSPRVHSRTLVAGAVLVCSTVSPANRPEVTVPVKVYTRAPPVMVEVALPEMVLVWPVFQVMVNVLGNAWSNCWQDQPGAEAWKPAVPEVRVGVLAETHGPYWVETETVVACGVAVKAGLKATTVLVGGVQVTSSGLAEAGLGTSTAVADRANVLARTASRVALRADMV